MEQVYRIGIDHGYGNIKTAHHIFESGVIERERALELAGMTVEYEGKFYEIGSTHKEYQMDKVWNEDYYILTLAALAVDDFPREVVRSRFLKINSSHVEYVFDCIDNNTTKVGNIKAYLLTALYNAPATMGSYYRVEVNHDLYGT